MKKAKTTGQLIKQLQPIFNKYIRLRDKDKPCISCGEYKTLQAGHYVAVSSCSGMRFNEDNVHGECAGCNNFDESHIVGYTVNLRKKIGEEDYSSLIKEKAYFKQHPVTWSRPELREMIEYYKAKVKELENN